MRRPPPPVVLPADSADELEARFYEAMADGDAVRMMALWADDDEILCVHPNGARLVGPAAVRAGYDEIFAGGAGVRVQPEQVHRLHTADCAVHHLVEKIEAEGVQAWMLALNVYVRTGAGWRIVAHHASPMKARMAPPPGDAPATLH